MKDHVSAAGSTPDRPSAAASDAAAAPAAGAGRLSRRAVLVGSAGVAVAALLADATGFAQGVAGQIAGTGAGSGAAVPGDAAQAAGTPVEPRHGAGEWTEDPAQASLSQSTTPVVGDIAAMPLDRSL